MSTINCLMSSGYVLGCQSVGGVEKVWLGTWSADTAYSFDANNVVTGVTSANNVFEMEQDIEFAGLVQTGNFDRSTGTVFYDTDLSMKFIELDADLRNLLVQIGRAPIYAVIKSNAGQYYIAGVETAGRATAGTASLGVALSDMNGVEMTIQFKSQSGVFLMNESVLGTGIIIA